MKCPEYIDQSLLDLVTQRALEAPRHRKNYNFHLSDDDPCNRLLNAVEPESYIPPHRHNESTKDETFLVLRGRLILFFFDDEGRVTEQKILGPDESAVGVNIPHGVWHSAMALETGTVFFEAKAGPYTALTPSEKASWAPVEGADNCAVYIQQLREQIKG